MAVRKRAAVRSALNYLRFADEVVILQNRADLNVETRPRAWRDLARHGVANTRMVSVEGDNIAKSLIEGAHPRLHVALRDCIPAGCATQRPQSA